MRSTYAYLLVFLSKFEGYKPDLIRGLRCRFEDA
jgi:hypothetical protein